MVVGGYAQYKRFHFYHQKNLFFQVIACVLHYWICGHCECLAAKLNPCSIYKQFMHHFPEVHQALSTPFPSHFFPLKPQTSVVTPVLLQQHPMRQRSVWWNACETFPGRSENSWQRHKKHGGCIWQSWRGKRNGKECQRMMRKVAVYQGHGREQLAINAEIFPFRDKCHILPYSFHTFYFKFCWFYWFKYKHR